MRKTQTFDERRKPQECGLNVSYICAPSDSETEEDRGGVCSICVCPKGKDSVCLTAAGQCVRPSPNIYHKPFECRSNQISISSLHPVISSPIIISEGKFLGSRDTCRLGWITIKTLQTVRPPGGTTFSRPWSVRSPCRSLEKPPIMFWWARIPSLALLSNLGQHALFWGSVPSSIK